jgi:hypothetical protein
MGSLHFEVRLPAVRTALLSHIQVPNPPWHMHIYIYIYSCSVLLESWIRPNQHKRLIACISHRKIPADDFRMIHSQRNNMLSYIMSLQTNIAM